MFRLELAAFLTRVDTVMPLATHLTIRRLLFITHEQKLPSGGSPYSPKLFYCKTLLCPHRGLRRLDCWRGEVVRWQRQGDEMHKLMRTSRYDVNLCICYHCVAAIIALSPFFGSTC